MFSRGIQYVLYSTSPANNERTIVDHLMSPFWMTICENHKFLMNLLSAKQYLLLWKCRIINSQRFSDYFEGLEKFRSLLNNLFLRNIQCKDTISINTDIINSFRIKIGLGRRSHNQDGPSTWAKGLRSSSPYGIRPRGVCTKISIDGRSDCILKTNVSQRDRQGPGAPWRIKTSTPFPFSGLQREWSCFRAARMWGRTSVSSPPHRSPFFLRGDCASIT